MGLIDMDYGIVILTYNAEKTIGILIEKLLKHKDKILIVDSSSSDQTIDIVKSYGIKYHIIDKKVFNHGLTREKARKILNTDIVVFMTQDAIPANDDLIPKLIQPILEGKAHYSYARQIPHKGAGFFEAFPRYYNYPEESQIRSKDDINKYGVYAFFSSDSCSAYLNSALDSIGGFGDVLTSEDYIASAKLIESGYKIAYVAEAIVFHSHNYSLIEEFKRYFDTAYIRAQNPWIQELVGHAEKRGLDFFKCMLKEIIPWKIHLLPYAIISTFVKLLGYRLGFLLYGKNKNIVKYFSSQRYYWENH